MAHLSKFFKTTVLGWGFLTNYEFGEVERFPYFTNIISNSLSLGYCILKVLELYRWDKVSILYTTNEVNYCDGIIRDVETALNDEFTYSVTIALKIELRNTNDYSDALKKASARSRIIIICIDAAKNRREFFLKASELNMVSEEYVYLNLGMKSLAFGQSAAGHELLPNGLTPFWEDIESGNLNGRETIVKDAAKRMLVIDLNNDVLDQEYMIEFKKNVVARVRQEPMYCETEACKGNTGKAMGSWARHLHDAFYLYGSTLNESLTIDPVNGHRNASELFKAMQGTFLGLTGEVTINANGTRDPLFTLYGLDTEGKQTPYMNLTYVNGQAEVSLGYTEEAITIWATRGGKRPLSRPLCGFSGTECPRDFWEQYLVYVIVAGTLILMFSIAICILMVCIYRTKQIEQERLKAEWQIPFSHLRKPPSKKELLSKRSLQSNPSTLTGDSKFTINTEFGHYDVYFFEKDPVLSTKHSISELSKEDYEIFPKLRKLDHDNINKFIGLSIDGIHYLTVWRMCARGSLQEIINKGNFTIDAFFMFCLIRDIAEGLHYLHGSFLSFHGRLRSSCCLVNDSWQVKISDYGMRCLVDDEKMTKKQLLWVAPEHLRNNVSNYSKEGDIYSFAIICSEIITRRAAWNHQERNESIDELLYLIRKGGAAPIRPEIILDAVEISSALIHLVRDCWSENSTERPTSTVICSLLKAMMPNKKSNLMDHVFNILEEYTNTLELEVEERTKELTEEKKKADILLGRMLPKQVAERLKLGQTVEPEGFDSVTVFFSDVVKFTQLAAKCSPYQVVNLLNDLYNNFDSIIEEHDVYKVESIGDGYLCVSGLPARNGSEHIKEIVELSLDLMEYVKSFRISDLPKERVDLRIGINSGPCVAGVVGLSMPRYCLFGDTVNTASRMESNGKAGFIHMSAAAHDLLVARYSNEYETQSRGEVIIKGKGVMETFWIHGRKGEEHLKKFTPVEEPNIKPGSPFSSEEIKHENSVEAAMYKEFKRNETIDVL